MKNKTKKILASVGLIIASCGLLAGCTSDITFNQKDLDNLMNNATTYLETQNNYSSEFVRNSLNNYLINGLENAINEKNISYTSTTEMLYYGNTIYTETFKFKKTNDGQTIKEFVQTEDGTTYREIAINKEENTTTYDAITYIQEGEEKTYTVVENSSNIERLYVDFVDYVDYYSQLMLVLQDSELEWTDFIMESKDDIVTFKCIAINPSYVGDTKIIGSMILEFKNGKIQKAQQSICNFDSSSYSYNGYYSSSIILFDSNVAIDFDKTGYSLVTE